MITYRELSSLSADLGFSPKALYTVSFHRGRHYRKVRLPKPNGEVRELCVPDKFLKAIQRRIADVLLVHEEVSPYATAYRYGGSTLKNAAPHVGKPVVLKLDIRHFFDHVIYPLVKEKVFPAERYSDSIRILLTMLCMYRDALPQGAPTSPAVSNIILRDFDNAVGGWCRQHGIAYTRYCDDMTFSGDFDSRTVIHTVKTELSKLGLFLNEQKTRIVRSGQKQLVTGLVVNQKLNTASDYRRKLRQELYYCRKFGIADHLARQASPLTEDSYLRQLLGRVNYVLQATPGNAEFAQNRQWLTEKLAALTAP